jgi:hypothetical protein
VLLGVLVVAAALVPVLEPHRAVEPLAKDLLVAQVALTLATQMT